MKKNDFIKLKNNYDLNIISRFLIKPPLKKSWLNEQKPEITCYDYR